MKHRNNFNFIGTGAEQDHNRKRRQFNNVQYCISRRNSTGWVKCGTLARRQFLTTLSRAYCCKTLLSSRLWRRNLINITLGWFLQNKQRSTLKLFWEPGTSLAVNLFLRQEGSNELRLTP